MIWEAAYALGLAFMIPSICVPSVLMCTFGGPHLARHMFLPHDVCSLL
jgi:hypothetical protein